MATKSEWEIDVTGLANFQPYEGDGDAAYFEDGDFRVLIEKAAPYKGKSGKRMLRLVCTTDDGDHKGERVYSYVNVEGVDKNGRAMIHQLGEVLVSTGISTVEKVQGIAAKKTLNLEQIAKAIQGKHGFARVEAGEYEGKLRSGVASWLQAEKYEESKAAGRHRRGFPLDRVSGGGSNGATAPADVLDLGGSPTTGAAPAATPSAISALDDLGL